MVKVTRFCADNTDFVVEMPEEVMSQLIAVADRSHPFETGSCLFGSHSDDLSTLIIKGMAPISPASHGTRLDFIRRNDGLHDFFRDLWERSRGDEFYVGEFHSHQSGFPIPSEQDNVSLHGIAKAKGSQCRQPVLFLIGGQPENRSHGLYIYTKKRCFWLRKEFSVRRSSKIFMSA